MPFGRAFYSQIAAAIALVLVLSIGTSAQDAAGDPIPQNVYWGDTHVHTSNSSDAGRYTILVGPEEAYRFARGEKVRTDWGTEVQLTQPLDFLVVADHAENIGLWPGLRAADPLLLKSEIGRRWHGQLMGTNSKKPKGSKKGPQTKKNTTRSAGKPANRTAGKNSSGGRLGDDFIRSVWERSCATADRLNQPGVFTALIGYEWTSMPAGNNLHRVVIFKDSADRATQVLPFSRFDSENPEDLWQHMAAYEEKSGGNILAIPHNGNMSNGLMFAPQTFMGKPLTRGYAVTRSRWEPLVEITQLKGAAEAHPLLSPNDEFADYRIWDQGNMGTKQQAKGSGAKEGWMLPHEYTRSALKLGLDLAATLGVNPYKFGAIGGTDSHTGFATTWHDSTMAKRIVTESAIQGVKARKRAPSTVGQTIWEQVAGGIAAVWATENTREALFESMERKEVYATTGPRMTVRFFGGWDYVLEDATQPDPAKAGYAKGVPMGGDLTRAPAGKSPTFLLRAVKDPDGANLDRMQIIKGWRGKESGLQEKIYNVALSDGRTVDDTGKAKPVGNTVDVAKVSYTNSIGDPELAVVWTDPDFDKDELAFYYVRVLEIPTPRWTCYDAVRFNVKMGPEVPMTTQERAYTSPIWYIPAVK
jgi:hypothetical protein